jgi:hypothetical protein
MMRVHSNKLLSWPEVLHVSQVSRIYRGPWLNYELYRIMRIEPLIIHSYSDIDKLKEIRTYYLYEKYDLVGITTSKKMNDVYLPGTIRDGDYIAICNNTSNAPISILI